MSCDPLGLGTLQLEDPLGYAWWILGHVTTIYWYNVQGEMSSLDEVRKEMSPLDEVRKEMSFIDKV